ncbi:uncharacterized protein LOC131225622 [Magnolia sinica]|uniref:uncharacterized protein LOC131225622 n=1 Tax=Magnolia sinica TaxID=86752 RepID=UPI002659F847|nr:uncharacterized protein LOC131225622 [Magnolia sinica]
MDFLFFIFLGRNLTHRQRTLLEEFVKEEQQGGYDKVTTAAGASSSCLEWRYTYSLLEDAGLETWAVDILGWDFSDLDLTERLLLEERDPMLSLCFPCTGANRTRGS